LPSTKTARLALRTQQIIAHESGVAKYADPFGGSYLIEDMTDKYIKETFKIIENIDDLGGAVSAIENKYMEDAISSSAYEYQKKVENSENIIIGVNKYEDKNKNDPDLQKIDPKKVKDQIESLKRFKENRDNLQVIQKLKKLEESAKNDINVMPDIISCIENDCTLGEISDSIRNVFGEY
jgi:methylmalonyl-CoA mutase N-terminal domain/subunit